ncbi:MAG: TIGR01212 family radical SAM protein, partial [SAR324 cluster bacterium]|nr:TIGR01212 family radical SAM protein [SAR324 cluster bacterium]
MKNCTPFENGKRYYPLSQHYREHFGEKVYKVSVSVAESCPNREGHNGMTVCIFCDEWGSAAYHQFIDLPILKQIQINREAIRKRYKAEKFLIYFQAYTNTFGHFRDLETLYHKALKEKDVVGLVVGTRPDCLPKRILQKFAVLSQEQYLSVELGVQTFDDHQLNFLSRGHDSATSIEAIRKLKSLPNVNICVHLIFGLPHETDQQIRETAQLLSELEVNGVKLHNLHVLRNTALEKLFNESKFIPIELEEYARRVAIFLEYLSPKIAVHR